MERVVVSVDVIVKKQGFLVFEFDDATEAKKFITDVNFEGDVREDVIEVDEVLATLQNDTVYKSANYASAVINNIITDPERNLTPIDMLLVKKYHDSDNLNEIVENLKKRLNDE